MNKAAKVRHSPQRKRDLLDDLMERGATDEMGLLDLLFIEEVLNQKEHENAG